MIGALLVISLVFALQHDSTPPKIAPRQVLLPDGTSGEVFLSMPATPQFQICVYWIPQGSDGNSR
jgi:hypothetical protein